MRKIPQRKLAGQFACIHPAKLPGFGGGAKAYLTSKKIRRLYGRRGGCVSGFGGGSFFLGQAAAKEFLQGGRGRIVQACGVRIEKGWCFVRLNVVFKDLAAQKVKLRFADAIFLQIAAKIMAVFFWQMAPHEGQKVFVRIRLVFNETFTHKKIIPWYFTKG